MFDLKELAVISEAIDMRLNDTFTWDENPERFISWDSPSHEATLKQLLDKIDGLIPKRRCHSHKPS